MMRRRRGRERLVAPPIPILNTAAGRDAKIINEPQNARTMESESDVRHSTSKELDDPTHASGLLVIVEGASVSPVLSSGRRILEASSGTQSPDLTVTSFSDVDDDDAAESVSPDTSLFDSEEEDCSETTTRTEQEVRGMLDNTSNHSELIRLNCELEPSSTESQRYSNSFVTFRINYLVVMMAIMLADGLQGTHLYILYEGYGYSVASLYCLGFLTGAVTSPITGPLVDRFGRKKSALAYCILEIAINQLEQYHYLPGLIVSRVVGGVTTNLLGSVFETWLDTEYRRRGFEKSDYGIIMRDSVLVSNLAAVLSGYFAHLLADSFGPKGPFKGAVTFTAIALAVVMVVWTENYGSSEPGTKSAGGHLRDAFRTFKSDSRALRVCLIHGLTTGAIQIFIFLWSPSLRAFAKSSPLHVVGIDMEGEPAYGLIFGSFMACGVIGGIAASRLRKVATLLLSPLSTLKDDTVEVEGEGEVRPMAIEFLAAWCYMTCSVLLLTPCIVSSDGPSSFMLCLAAFLLYELMIGIYLPTAGVIRSIYLPANSRCSLLTMPQVIVNVAVSLGVASTNYITLQTAFAAVSLLMMTAAALQLTLVSPREWSSFFGRVDHVQKLVRRLSSSTCETIRSSLDQQYGKSRRSQSAPIAFLDRSRTSSGSSSGELVECVSHSKASAKIE